jgi:hypothetical protein
LAPQGALVIVCLAAPSRCVRLTANVKTHMTARLFVSIVLLTLVRLAVAGDFPTASTDRTISGQSVHPIAVDSAKVGTYSALVKSGAGYFYDDVLEYRVWLHPERGAPKKNGNSDYFVAFAQYERALAFSQQSKGAEEPLVLIRQLKHVNEPKPGVFEVIEGERIAEWRVEWLRGSKRTPGAIERFLAQRRK